MSYYPDLDTTSMLGSGEKLRAIGWLNRDYWYTRGVVSEQFLYLLKTHVSSAFQPCSFAGFHECEFCNNAKGFSNVVVPTRDVVYVAPQLIVHYIVEHGYRPPDEFVTAVTNCPQQESPEYMALLLPYFSYFRISAPDPLPNHEQQVKLARLISRAFVDIQRLCRDGNNEGAAALASAFAEMPQRIAGWGLWYRRIFSRLVRNGRRACPRLDDYLVEYNSIFGGDTDPQ